MSTFFFRHRAFTIVELLISIAVISVLFIIIASAFSSFNRNASVVSSTQIVLSALKEARTKTLASQGESVYGVHFGAGSVTLFKGGVYNALDPENEEKKLPASTTISNTALQGGGSEVVFIRLTGATGQYGIVSVSGLSSAVTKTITIEQTGVVHE